MEPHSTPKEKTNTPSSDSRRAIPKPGRVRFQEETRAQPGRNVKKAINYSEKSKRKPPRKNNSSNIQSFFARLSPVSLFGQSNRSVSPSYSPPEERARVLKAKEINLTPIHSILKSSESSNQTNTSAVASTSQAIILPGNIIEVSSTSEESEKSVPLHKLPTPTEPIEEQLSQGNTEENLQHSPLRLHENRTPSRQRSIPEIVIQSPDTPLRSNNPSETSQDNSIVVNETIDELVNEQNDENLESTLDNTAQSLEPSHINVSLTPTFDSLNRDIDNQENFFYEPRFNPLLNRLQFINRDRIRNLNREQLQTAFRRQIDQELWNNQVDESFEDYVRDQRLSDLIHQRRNLELLIDVRRFRGSINRVNFSLLSDIEPLRCGSYIERRNNSENLRIMDGDHQHNNENNNGYNNENENANNNANRNVPNNNNNRNFNNDNDFYSIVHDIPLFEGNSEDLPQFIGVVNDLYRLLENDRDRTRFFIRVKAKIRGEIRQLFLNREFETWPELRYHLLNSVSTREHRQTIRDEIKQLKQLKDESVAAYAKRARAIKQKLNSTFGAQLNEDTYEQNDVLTRDYFIRGLLNEELKKDFYKVGKESFEEAVTYITFRVTNTETVERAPEQPTAEVCTFCQVKNHSEKDCNKKKRMVEGFKAMRNPIFNQNQDDFNPQNFGNYNNFNPRNARPPRPNLFCFNCNQNGHETSQCRQWNNFYRNQFNQNQNFGNPNNNYPQRNQNSNNSGYPPRNYYSNDYQGGNQNFNSGYNQRNQNYDNNNYQKGNYNRYPNQNRNNGGYQRNQNYDNSGFQPRNNYNDNTNNGGNYPSRNQDRNAPPNREQYRNQNQNQDRNQSNTNYIQDENTQRVSAQIHPIPENYQRQ